MHGTHETANNSSNNIVMFKYIYMNKEDLHSVVDMLKNPTKPNDKYI